MAAKIRKGDKVVVLTGRDKGRTGEVIEVRPDQDRALVRGVNMVKRHQRQTAQQEGGIISKESSVHLSNLAVADPKDGKPNLVAKRSASVADVEQQQRGARSGRAARNCLRKLPSICVMVTNTARPRPSDITTEGVKAPGR